jgi:hypothetical protein
MRKKRNAYEISVGIPEGKRPIIKLGRRWDDNITIDLKKFQWENVGRDASGSG